MNYKALKEIPIVFYDGYTHDHHFIIKQLEKDFKGQFDWSGENKEKYVTFSVPIKNDNDKQYTVCSYHVTYAFPSKSTLYSWPVWLNV